MLFKSALRLRALLTVAIAAISVGATAQVHVTTYHNDNLRTGLNAQETTLLPNTVNPQNFGLLFTLPVDGQVYAQPLYLSGLNIPGKGVHNVVFVATEHNSLYAFDADSNSGANAQPLWQTNFGPSVPSGDTGSDDVTVEIGITSTPAIGIRGSGVPVIYVVAKTKTFDGSGNPVYTHKLHAVSAATGAEQPGSPIEIKGSVPGTGEGSVNAIVEFNPRIQFSRSGLLLLPAVSSTGKGTVAQGNTLLIAFASHGDNGPYHGWVFTYDVDKMKLKSILNTSPNARTDPSGYPLAAGGIWQGGAGPASDGSNIFFATGNGMFNPAEGSFGDSVVRMDRKTLGIVDYFTPWNQESLNDYDTDLGSGAVMVLPPSASGSYKRALVVQSGKEGSIYLMDAGNMGKYHATDTIRQVLPYAIGGIWGCPAYFNNTVYFGPIFSPLVSFPISNGLFTTTSPAGYSPTFFKYPGPTPSVSANGNADGIVWAIQTEGARNGAAAVLHAYNAANIGVELYSSAATQGRDFFGGAIKFSTPTIANGKVFAGANGAVGVFGIGTWAASPVVSPPAGNYSGSVLVSMSDPTPGASIYYTTNGSVPTTSSTLYTGPVTFSQSTIVKARAFLNGAGASAVVENDYLIDAVIGSGTGLLGSYFDGKQDPSGVPTASQVDATVNFNWGANSPISGVAGTNWAGEWTGQLQAETTGTYTLTTNSDDGVRVYIDGQLVIDNYTYHGATLNSATLNFQAGHKYDIDIKFFQGGGDDVLQLFWEAPGLPYQIVPTSQLYPGAIAPVITPSGGNYANPVSVTVTDATPGADIYYTTDGSYPTTASTLYTGPVTVSTSAAFKARAFIGGAGSAVTEQDYLINALGTGTGLWGSYYDGLQNPAGTPTASRLDPIVDFAWNGASPIAGVAGNNWAGEWTGQIQAETSGTYTFTTNSDDGVRLTINGQVVVDNYTYHGPVLNSGTITLAAGQKYGIDIKYFQGGGQAVLQLFWAGPAVPYQLVPTTQLYSLH